MIDRSKKMILLIVGHKNRTKNAFFLKKQPMFKEKTSRKPTVAQEHFKKLPAVHGSKM